MKRSYNQLLKLADDTDDDNDDLDYIKKYHEKHFKVYKQQKMPLIGGGGHHNVQQSSTIVLPGGGMSHGNQMMGQGAGMGNRGQPYQNGMVSGQ